ncbi:MAG: hypothetical protein ACO3HJ_00755 [Methylophilaceae bacterium]
MEDLSKQINEEGQKYQELPDAIAAPKEKVQEFMEKVENNLEESHIATAVENDEINNDEAQKEEILENLEYADGKERDEVDLIEEQEKIYGTDTLSPFKTADVRVFRRRLDTMSREQMNAMAERVAARIYSSENDQKTELLQAFHSWVSRNGSFQTSATKKAEKGALSAAFEGSIDVKELEEKLKSKTLSELQETAARLGFNPGFDRDRIIGLVVKEYQRQA